MTKYLESTPFIVGPPSDTKPATCPSSTRHVFKIGAPTCNCGQRTNEKAPE